MGAHAFPHYEESLQRDIDKIRQKTLEMSRLGELAIGSALQALLTRNRQLAYTIILRDQYIDQLETELDRLCLEFILRQQPVAQHLRFVYATTKIMRDLERIGDYAESIARQVLLLDFLDKIPLEKEFTDLANLAVSMVHDATQIFLSQDVKKAATVMELEAKADEMRYSINAELTRLQQTNQFPLEALTPLINIARRFERVTDQAKNICEEVLYITTGEFFKHKNTDTFYILFIDEQNAAYSQIAEAVGKSLKLPHFEFASAGLDPKPLDPLAVAFAAEKKLDVTGQAPKKINQVPKPEYVDVIVTLSPKVKNTTLPENNKAICLQWNIAHFFKGKKSAQEVHDAYEKASDYLEHQIKDLAQAILGEKNEKNSRTKL